MGNAYQTHSEGVDLVTAELTRRRIAHEPSHKRTVDLHISDQIRGRTVDVMVKMKGRTSSDWQDHIELKPTAEPLRESVFYVFVDRGETGTDQPRFWIVPFAWMRQDVYEDHRRWLDQHGGKRPNNPSAVLHTIGQNRIDQWRDRWDLLAPS
jgi:hypothetical protein